MNPWNAYELRYLATVFGVSELIADYEALKQMSLVDVLVSKLIVKSRLNWCACSRSPDEDHRA
jgi:hypothetical protein